VEQLLVEAPDSLSACRVVPVVLLALGATAMGGLYVIGAACRIP